MGEGARILDELMRAQPGEFLFGRVVGSLNFPQVRVRVHARLSEGGDGQQQKGDSESANHRSSLALTPS